MQLSPVVAQPIPANLQPKLPTIADAPGVVLASVSFRRPLAHQQRAPSYHLAAGVRVTKDASWPGSAGVASPSITPVAGAFEDALHAAIVMAQRTPLNNHVLSGSQPVAVIQAADGAYAIMPLLEARSGSWVVFAPRDQLDHRRLEATWTRESASLQAVVSAKEWVDFRSTPVGSEASAR